MQEALKLWAKYKDTPLEDLDPYVAEKMKKVKHALLQLKRESLEAEEMQRMALEMNDIMSWYLSEGYKIQDLKLASRADVAKFKKAQGLLTLWGIKVEPSAEQLKEIADALIHFRRNQYNPQVFDQYDGEEGAKFKKLHKAMIDWRLGGAESSNIQLPDEGEAIAKEIESALQWWKENGDTDDVPEFTRPEDIFSAEKVKILMDKWEPRDAETTLTWMRSKKQFNEIVEAIDMWRDNGKTFDVDSLNVKPSEREVLLKLKETMLEWRRSNASNISEVEAEQTVKEMINAMNWWKKKGKEYDAIDHSSEMVPAMMRHQKVTDTLSDWHRDLGMPEHEFKHLSAKEAKKLAKDMNDAMNWWERSGKDIDISKEMEDADEFEKARRLAQFWHKANMPTKDKEQAVKEITKLFDWMRKKNKNFDLDVVSDPKVDHIRKLFNAWGGKKNRKPKVIAREIEDALDWWRRNDFVLDEEASPAEEEKMDRLENLAQKWHQVAHPENAPGSDANLDWFRKQKLDDISETLDLYEGAKPKSDAGPSLATRTDEQKRADEMASALDWLRSNDADLDLDDEMSVAMSVATFKKIDSLMAKSGESGGASSVENALDWLRSKGDVDDETVNSFKKLDSVMARVGLKDSIAGSGFGGALDWLRQRQAEKATDDDASARSFGKKDILSTKPKTEEEKRAAEMANALDWLKSNDAAEDIDYDDMSTGLSSMASFKQIGTKSGDASGGTDVPSALDWLRKQEKKSVPTVEEGDEDDDDDAAFAGVVKKSKEQDAADSMARALDWLRDSTVGTAGDDASVSMQSHGIGSFSPFGSGGSESKELDNALNWLRSKNPDDLANIDDSDFSTIGGYGTIPKSKEQQKAQQMSKALDWLRANGANLGGDDDMAGILDYDSQFSSIASKGFGAEDKAREMEKALDWLRDKDPNSLGDLDDPFGQFEGMHTKTKEQEKAEAMAKALGWLRNKGGDFDEDDAPDFNFDKFGLGDQSALKSSEADRAREMQDALNWLRKSGTGVDIDEDDEYFKFQKLDAILPKKEGQSAEGRAKEMENALNWLRAQGIDLDDDDTDIESFDKIGIIPVGMRSGDSLRDRDMQSALDWLRGRNSTGESGDGDAFSQLDAVLPARPGQTEEDRAKDMENALAWLRANGVDVYNEDGIPSFDKLGTAAIVPRSTQERSRDVQDALNWLRAGGNDSDDPSGVFKKIQNMLPAGAPGQSELDRAKEMENALNWLRSSGVDLDDFSDDAVPEFKSIGSPSFGGRSPGSNPSAKDVAAILKWLRNPSDNTLDPTGVFKKLQASLPFKKGQSLQDRAQDIANALYWMRQRGLDPTMAEDYDSSFSKVGQVPATTRSASDRAKDMEDALNWLRGQGMGDDDTYDPNGIFRKLDSTLPKKKGQTPEDRAKELENAMNWMRQQGLDVSDYDEDGYPGGSKVGFESMATKSPEGTNSDMQNALNWLRHHDSVADDVLLDPSGVFKKLDASLPSKKGQSFEDRAKDMMNALAWMREKGLMSDDQELGLPEFSNLSSSLPRKSPEQHAKEMEDALNWLRSGGVGDDNDLGSTAFKKIDGMLPPRQKGQSNDDRAAEILGALDWMRAKGLYDDDGYSIPGFQPTDSVPISKRSPEQRAQDVKDALNWLRQKGKDDDTYDPTGGFRRLDQMLPRKKGQSLEDRAQAIEMALDWLRDQGLQPSDQDAADQLKLLESIDITRRSPEQRAKDLSDALNWLRHKGEDDASYDPNGEFRKLDGLLPAKKGQSPEDRARELEGALDWMRSKGFGLADTDSLPGFGKVPSVEIGRRSPEQRAKDLSDALNWLRHKGEDDSSYDPTGDFRKLDGLLPAKKGQTPEDRARELEGALDWMRSKGAGPADADTLPGFDKVPNMKMSKRTPEQRAKDLSDALNWIRKGKSKKDKKYDPNGEFRKLDKLLPKKRDQNEDDRAREIEGALDWMRDNDVSPDDDDVIDKFSAIGSIPLSKRTPEQRAKDLSDALNWMRNKAGDVNNTMDPSGEFRKLDGMLPKKQGLTEENRARLIESCIDWLRHSDVSPVDELVPTFDKVGTVPATYRTPEQRAEEMDKVMNWLRRKGKKDTKYDPTGEYRRLDGLIPQKKGQSLDDRAREIEGALDWTRTNEVPLADDSVVDQFEKIGSVPLSRRTPEQRSKDQQDALNWLRNKGKGDSLIDPTGEFKMIDSLLPKNKGQSKADRAKDIESALDWCRNKNVDGVLDTLPGFGKVPSVEIGRRSPEQRAKDLSDALNWLRHKGEDDSSYDPTGEFRKLDKLLPKKRGQTPEDRAQEIEGALDWIRSKGADAIDEDGVPKFGKIPTSAIAKRSPEERAKAAADALNWLRHKGKGNDQKYDPTGEFKKLHGLLPKKKGQSPEDRAKEIESALDWMRQNNVSLDDDESLEKFKKMGSIPMSTRSPEDRAKDLSDVLTWIRGGKTDSDDPSGEFRKLDGLLPTKKGQSPEDRARDIESALDWIRSKDVGSASDGTIPPFDKIHSTGIAKRSPEQRAKDLNNAMNWLRHKGQGNDKKYDPSGDFRKLDALLPQKQGQTPADRARVIEGSLDWCRNSGVSPENPEAVEMFKKIGGVPVSRRTPEQRAKDLSDTLNWLRQKGKDDSATDPNGEFRKLDGMLPKKAGQSPEARAREIEAALDWVRSNDVRPADDDKIPGFDKVPSTGIARRSPETRSKDLGNALNWIRHKGTGKDKKYDPTGEFRRLDGMLPTKRGQTPDERAREIEGALDFLRNNDVSPYDDDAVEQLKKIGSIPISRRTPEQRTKDLSEAMNWLRNKGKQPDGVIDPDGEFRKLDGMLPKKARQSPEDRARDLEGALDWIRSQQVKSVEEEPIPAFDSIPPIPVSKRSPEERTKDEQNALNWLRHKGEDDASYDPTGEFRKLDGMLPTKKGQTPEDRAKLIESALDWCRNHDVSPEDSVDFPDFNKIDSIPMSRRTPEQRAKDLSDALNWLRHKGEDDARYDPTEEFRRLDSLLPAKKGQSLEERAREIEGLMDWMRQNNVSPYDEAVVPALVKMGNIPIARRTPEERLTDVNDILTWLRNDKQEAFDSSGDFNRYDQLLPMKKGQRSKDRARDIENAMDWCRSKGIKPTEDGDIPGFKKIGSIPVSKRSPEDRKKETDAILNWLRAGKPEDDDAGSTFKKIDSMLPTKDNQTPQDRAKQIESALDWMRNLGLEIDEDNEPLPPLDKLGSLSVSRRSPEERAKDLDSILDWMRSGKADSADPTGEFKRIDGMLPKKKGQKPRERAKAIEDALNWIRHNGVLPTSEGS